MTAEATVWAWDCSEHDAQLKPLRTQSSEKQHSWRSLATFKWISSPLPTSSFTFSDICHFVDILFT
jgi:hypothetical protein